MSPEKANDDHSDIYVEFVRRGNSVKVTAIDAASGVEATIIGPRSANSADLQSLAVTKLRVRLGEKSACTTKENAPAKPRRGIVV